MSLQDEIDLKAKEINSDSYAMSIGEIVSLYKDEELDIHPDFQRIYRWNASQKTKLIESILLGIPIPSIFVAQREDGIWDVIDGLQRLSTIFEFMGILKDEDDNTLPPLVLNETEYLPSLGGKYWESKQDNKISFNQTQRLIIKRARIDVQIVKRESDNEAKYELFQRLNTGGSTLSNQEVRNCLLVMLNKEKYIWIKTLAQNKDFLECISITERSLKESYDNELVLRFIVYRHSTPEEISRAIELSEILTKKMIDFIKNSVIDFDNEEKVFNKTFALLNKALGDNAFRKFQKERGVFKGPFSISAFEAIIPGLSQNIDQYSDNDIDDIAEKIKNIWSTPKFSEHAGAGIRAANRVKFLFSLSREVFLK